MLPNIDNRFIGNTVVSYAIAIIISAAVSGKEDKPVHPVGILFFTEIFFEKRKPAFSIQFDVFNYLFCLPKKPFVSVKL